MDTEKIKSYIETIISLSDEEWEILSTHIEYKILKKNEYLLQEGVICNFIAFINKRCIDILQRTGEWKWDDYRYGF